MFAALSHNAIFDRPQVPLLSLLGLDQRTSQSCTSDRYYFAWPLLSQKLSILKNLAGRSRFVVVMGEHGCGKTTMLHRLIADGRHEWRAGRIRIKLPGDKPIRRYERLNHRLVFLSRKADLPSLAIDDAHQLSPTELRLLIQRAFASDSHFRLQGIVLFSDPSIRRHFGDIGRWLPPKNVMDRIDIPQLSEKQTIEYLAHRFKQAGILSKPPFSRSQLRAIYQQSCGLPGRINLAAFATLKAMCRGGHHFPKPLLRMSIPDGWRQLKPWGRRPLGPLSE
jgi:type II secretory pathway predicted ATPase ExeA